MSIQPPRTPAPVKAIPTPEDPPSIQDITNAINYLDTVKSGYRTSRPGCPTAEDLANAYIYQSSIISARAGSAVAPPWFKEAMKSALADGLKPLEEKVEQLDKKFEQLDKKVERLDKKVEQLDQKIDQVKEEVDQVKVELRETSRITNETYNLQCVTGEFRPYKIVRFIDGTLPTDDHQLRPLHTAQDIRRLGVRQMQKYLEGYGLPDSDNPKQAIANAIGCATTL